MNGCHWDAGHQGQQQMMYLLQDQFWWPGMATHIQKAVSSCEQCIKYEGTCAKAPMQPTVATSALELLHIDFTSIDMTLELDQPPNMVNVLVFCNHFMKHIMVYVTTNQTAKTIAKFLWQGYILIFGAPAKLLSNWGANFESSIIKDLWELMGIWKVRTSPYHAQTNRQVEWAHQTLMHMIGKLSKDQKADWLKHLPELVHAYNSMRSAITGYNPHYLMFWCWPHLPINFYFPTIWEWRNTGMSTTTLPSYANDCEKPSSKYKSSPLLGLRDRSDTMIERLMPFYWKWPGPGKSWCLQGEEESDGLVGGGPVWSGIPGHWGHLFIPFEEWADRMLTSSPLKLTFSCHPCGGHSPLYSHTSCTGRVYCHHPRGNTSDRSEAKKVPQSADCLPLAEQQTVETPLGWVIRKFCTVLLMSSRVSTLEQGWRVWCRGTRGVQASMPSFLWQRYWSYQWSL